MKFLAWFLLLLGSSGIVRATEQEGYILNSSGDTVKGFVDVEMKRQGFGKKELDLAGMEQAIGFKETGGKWKHWKAGDISGYGFTMDDIWYHFVVLDFPKNNWKKSAGAFERRVNNLRLFIHRSSDGAVPLYKDYYRMPGGRMGPAAGRNGNHLEDLYIFSTDLGYVEVAPANGSANKRFKEFVMKYLNLDEEFLNGMDDKSKFSDAEELLKSYNEWKKRH